uniref:Uncharacterized protein n=1 Tax=Schizaphis graminum TaxID=13262 RepID=A0A2S2NP75_SCHGA
MLQTYIHTVLLSKPVVLIQNLKTTIISYFMSPRKLLLYFVVMIVTTLILIIILNYRMSVKLFGAQESIRMLQLQTFILICGFSCALHGRLDCFPISRRMYKPSYII